MLTGFKEVEDNLAALRILEEEAAMQDEAVQIARQSVMLTTNQYKAGIVSYLDVVLVQATALEQREHRGGYAEPAAGRQRAAGQGAGRRLACVRPADSLTNWRAATPIRAKRQRRHNDCGRQAHAERRQQTRCKKERKMTHFNATKYVLNRTGIVEVVRRNSDVTPYLIHRPSSSAAWIASVAVTVLFAVCLLGACSDKSGAQAEAKKTVPTVPV